MKVQIEESWRRQLQEEFDKPYFEHLVGFVKEEYARYTVFPPGSRIFHAYNTCPFEKVKVVILGQDPYHEPGQYYGLCFSVMDGVPFPPSLVNIFKEIQNDLSIRPPQHKHDMLPFIIQSPDHGIRKLFPAFSLMRTGLMCPYGQNGIDQ